MGSGASRLVVLGCYKKAGWASHEASQQVALLQCLCQLVSVSALTSLSDRRVTQELLAEINTFFLSW